MLLVHETLGGEGAGERLARRGPAELGERGEVGRPPPDLRGERLGAAAAAGADVPGDDPVSYTHLTLPTIYSV